MANEESAIRAVMASYNDALNMGSTDAALMLYAEDGVFMAPYSQSAVGEEAVRKAYDAVFRELKFDASSSERTETASGVSRATASRRRIRPLANSQSVRIVRRIRRGLAEFWTTQVEGDSDQVGGVLFAGHTRRVLLPSERARAVEPPRRQGAAMAASRPRQIAQVLLGALSDSAVCVRCPQFLNWGSLGVSARSTRGCRTKPSART